MTLTRERLCVVGDVHGHLRELRAGLASAGLIDEQGAWAGANARLAVLGDLLDRGPDGVGVIAFLMRLQEEAAHQAGKVIVLLGNHEVLFLGAKCFGDAPTSSERGSFLSIWQRLGGIEADITTISDAQIEWLRQLPAMHLEGDYLLVHADTTQYTDFGNSIEQVNARVREILHTPDPEELLTLLRAFGRRAFYGEGGAENLAAFVRTFGGTHVIHGHSPIANVMETEPASVTEALIYADGRCINVDPGLYLGGPGFVYQVA